MAVVEVACGSPAEGRRAAEASCGQKKGRGGGWVRLRAASQGGELRDGRRGWNTDHSRPGASRWATTAHTLPLRATGERVPEVKRVPARCRPRGQGCWAAFGGAQWGQPRVGARGGCPWEARRSWRMRGRQPHSCQATGGTQAASTTQGLDQPLRQRGRRPEQPVSGNKLPSPAAGSSRTAGRSRWLTAVPAPLAYSLATAHADQQCVLRAPASIGWLFTAAPPLLARRRREARGGAKGRRGGATAMGAEA